MWFCLMNSCYASTNVALGRPYTVSCRPNFSLTAPSSDTTALTDGVHTSGHFWTKKTTLGWFHARPVEICIDLGGSYPVDRVTFTTARGIHAKVYYPLSISVFTGQDMEHLLYVGDMADVVDNEPGAYQVRTFVLETKGTLGHYVLLIAYPRGAYLFCDEIEVIKGEVRSYGSGSLSLVDARQRAASQVRARIRKTVLRSMAEQMKVAPAGVAVPAGRIRELEDRLGPGSLLPKDGDEVESELLEIRAGILRARFPDKAFLISGASPWGRVSPSSLGLGELAGALTVTMPCGAYGYEAFVVTNLGAGEEKFSITYGAPENAELDVFVSPFLVSEAMEYVADPLVPLPCEISLRAGESILVVIRAQGRTASEDRRIITVHAQGVREVIPVVYRVVGVDLPKIRTLNGVNWNYLNFTPTTGKKDIAMADLFSHHTRVSVIHPSELGLTTSFPPSTSRLAGVLQRNRGAQKLLLCMNLRDRSILTSKGRFEPFRDAWKAWFRTWYATVMDACTKAGFTRDQVYLYPYDEMKGAEVDEFIAFASWLRSEFPAARVYATLSEKDSLRALPYLDIAQIINRDDVLSHVTPSPSTEIWIYDAQGAAKSLSPYSYYRLMAWKAFLKGYKGIGFWAYADTGWHTSPSSAWDDFDGKYADYAVVYEAQDQNIISSRRWEAWRMGIDDYEILSLYSRAFGDVAARELAGKVLENPANTTLADRMRSRMLNELAATKGPW